MDPQMFLGPERPTRAKFDPPENQIDGPPAKPSGGLWTSTLRDDESSPWLEWCRRERWGIGEETRKWILTPEPGVEIYTIDSVDDLTRLLDAYGRDAPEPFDTVPFARIDWEQLVRDDCDGVRLTEQGQADTRFSRPGLYGWDSECTVWLDWVFDEVEDAGPVDLDE